jgi:uncharacterized membrane protein YsdA (DUF1294 family)
MIALLLLHALLSLLAFATFGLDKRAARRGGRRVPEARLHLLALCGGWPGSFLGMAVFRHKRRKPGFVLLTACIALVQIGLWGWWLGQRWGLFA